MKIFTRDVPLNKEVPIKFWRSSGSEYGVRISGLRILTGSVLEEVNALLMHFL